MAQYTYIYATGNFRSNLSAFLDYSSNYYADTTEGAPIITTVLELFNCEQWTFIAEVFGINDPNDFNQHQIAPENINHNELHERLQVIGYVHDEADRLVERIRVLVSSKFEFIFCLANGEDR